MTHEPWLVLLSILLAVQGSYVGLQLATGSKVAPGNSGRLLLAGSALTLAVGIWSMHFVGMLAASLPQQVDFLVLPTLISFLTCVLVVGVGVAAMTMPWPRPVRIAVGGLAMGGGICLMHYIGMSAVHANANIEYSRVSILAAFLIAVLTSSLVLWMLNRTEKPMPIWLAAIALGIAVSGMHYMAMAGTSFALCETPAAADSPVLTRDMLAIIVTCIAFSVSGGFLLSLVPERRLGESEAMERETLPLAQAASPEKSAEQPPAVAQNLGDQVSLGEPLAEASSHANRSPFPESIAVEKDGRTRQIRVSDVRSIRANAHYTYISDGQQEFFCKLSISTIEANLDPQSFMRVHRSYIVSIDYVGAIRRQGENGLVELNGASVQCGIPVARARLPLLRKRVEEHFHLTNGGYPAAVRE